MALGDGKALVGGRDGDVASARLLDHGPEALGEEEVEVVQRVRGVVVHILVRAQQRIEEGLVKDDALHGGRHVKMLWVKGTKGKGMGHWIQGG